MRFGGYIKDVTYIFNVLKILSRDVVSPSSTVLEHFCCLRRSFKLINKCIKILIRFGGGAEVDPSIES